MHPSPSTVQNGEAVMLPGAASSPNAPTEPLPAEAAYPAPTQGYPDALGGIDPFVLWAATSGKSLNSPTTPVRRAKVDPRPAQPDRRKLLKLIAVGAVGLVTVVTVGGVSFARAPQVPAKSPPRIDDDRSDGVTSIDAHRDGDDDDWRKRSRKPHTKPTPSSSPTPRPSSTPTQTATPTPQPSPTSQPTQTPTPTPAPKGTVIGSTSQAMNSAVSFTNPADSQGSLLVHLSNGNWVACERACTHQGAWVNYDSTSGQLVCPAHGAIFDPLHACSHVSGPGSGPLANVSITVNANGTISTP